MAIYLGNLKTKDIMKRLGVELNDEQLNKLESSRIDNADVPKGKWHGFDIPFQITCGDKDTFDKVIEVLKPFSSEFKTPIQIAHK